MALTALILAIIVAVLLAVIWSYASENTRLRKALDKADDNDGRDLKTGRYAGKRAF